MVKFEDIYDSMRGGMRPEFQVPWVEDAFTEGSFCDEAYNEMSNAYERLRDRLGVVDEDEDVEIMIACFMDMQRELCKRMFLYGQEYDKHIRDEFDSVMQSFL